jgi:hypothetical protein
MATIAACSSTQIWKRVAAVTRGRSQFAPTAAVPPLKGGLLAVAVMAAPRVEFFHSPATPLAVIRVDTSELPIHSVWRWCSVA